MTEEHENAEILDVVYSQSAEIGELAKALATAQKDITNVKAESDNPFFKSKYADLAAITDICRVPLALNNIARHQAVVSRVTGEVGVRTMLAHSSGQWVAASVFCKPPQPGPQALGSVITYLRRYSLAAAVGIAQEDDDAESVTVHVEPAKRERGKPREVKPAAQAPGMEADHAEYVRLADQLVTKVKRKIGLDLKWDVKQSAAWLFDLFGVQKVAELEPLHLEAALDLLNLYGDEKAYPERLDFYRAKGTIAPLKKAAS